MSAPLDLLAPMTATERRVLAIGLATGLSLAFGGDAALAAATAVLWGLLAAAGLDDRIGRGAVVVCGGGGGQEQAETKKDVSEPFGAAGRN